MLGAWRSHSDYQSFLVENIQPIYASDKNRVLQFSEALSKLYNLDLDVLKLVLEPYYSNTGSPAKNQPEVFRSFVLMSLLKCHSITKWVYMLHHDDLLCYMIGVSPDNIPGVGTHYDLINRLWLEDPDIEKDRQDSLHPFKRKPRKKLAKNQKLPPRHPGIIQKFVDLALQGKIFESRPEKLLQQIFADVAVRPSANDGILGDIEKLTISGDGTCIKTGGSPFGIRTCDCANKGIFNCDCHRKFSDPDARYGWDSYHETWFYGYSGYFLVTYNEELKSDIPIYLRLVEAPRYDGVTAIIALSEARALYPDFVFDKFIGDCAHDNYPTYHLLNKWNIKPVIPLNKKNKNNSKYQGTIKINENGIPVCMAGLSMVYNGFMKDRNRIKWRCPFATGKVDSCNCKDKCSSSDYGRTVYTKPSSDPRLFTVIPRGSDEWKGEMKKRTSSERVNKRLLNDYELELSKTRGKKRWSFWIMIHSINIHLDARLKKSKFDFISMLDGLLGRAA